MSKETNAELHERARKVIPGGVNSPVRAFGAVGGSPRFFARGEGAYVVDEEGKRYLDFMQSWGPLILGHCHPEVIEVIQNKAALGTSFGAPCRVEVELAEAVVAAYPGLEQVRFVSSGTEAVMSAIRLARGATGRDLIVKFAGCYHGHADHLLVAAGSGLATAGQPSSAGVPKDFAALTRVLPLNDEAAAKALFAAEGSRIAAVIIEPIPANNGLLLQPKEFLLTLRRLTQEAGALLIFDEVISGFRVAKGGAAELFGITPDLATEQSAYWQDPGTGLRCRGRVDGAHAIYRTLIDLKSARNATPDAFKWTVAEYGYHWQEAMYRDGWELAGGWRPEVFLFFAVELEPPYLTGIYELSPKAVSRGWDMVRHYLAEWAECARRDEWPGLPADAPIQLELPPVAYME